MANNNRNLAKRNGSKISNKKRINYNGKNSKYADRADQWEKNTEHKYNDVSWYSKNEKMLRDSASYSYNNPVGTQINLTDLYDGTGNIVGTASNYSFTSVPSLMSLTYIPTIGLSNSSTSPANLAAQDIYSYVRYMNSGAKNYDQADIMLYLLAMDSIYMMWNWAKRIYGYVRTYSQVNRTLPTVLAAADGVNFADAVANMADYRFRLNALAARISAFCVPAVMPIFLRHSWMVSNIYKDSNNAKSQMYMFVPKIYYMYSETSSPNGGVLTATYNRGGITLGDVLTRIEDCLNRVGYSEDIGVMSGDILKAYGQDKLFKISPVEADYTVEPVYNEEVLNQIHNSTLIPQAIQWPTGTSRTVDALSITQNPDNGYLIYNPTIPTVAGLVQSGNVMINMPWDDVTPANTMVGTRLTSTMSYRTNNTATFTSLGSEWIADRIVYVMRSNGTFTSTSLPAALIFDANASNIVTSASQLQANLSALSNFDWHPLTPMGVQVLNTTSNITQINITGVVGDIDNYTFIDQDSLNAMHTAALMSEFNVPQLGSF